MVLSFWDSGGVFSHLQVPWLRDRTIGPSSAAAPTSHRGHRKGFAVLMEMPPLGFSGFADDAAEHVWALDFDVLITSEKERPASSRIDQF